MWAKIQKKKKIEKEVKTIKLMIYIIHLKFLSWIYLEIINLFNDIISNYHNKLS